MAELDTDTCALSGINIVEAGAGTGKTYSIQKLVLRLVLEKEVPLPKLLVVTYTEAATGELLDRLHAILQLAQEALDAKRDIFSDKHFEQIHGILRKQHIEVPENRRRCRLLVQNALRDYDQASVMTIHGFCQKMLQTNAFLSFVRYGVELRPNIAELQKKIAMDFCRKVLYDENSPFVGTPLSPEQLLDSAMDAISNAYNGARIIWPDAEQGSTVSITEQFFEFYKAQMELYKAKEGFITFDDLIYKMYNLVKDDAGAPLRRVIREMYSYVFVDEFQDTDPCQYKIFSKIFKEGTSGDDNHGFFMIGDPKQAIYSFRGGDLDAYLEAVGNADNPSLTTNYRSGKQYIDALKRFYEHWQNPFEKGIQVGSIQHGKEIDNLYHGNNPEEKPLQFVPFRSKDAVLEWTVNKVLDLLSPGYYSIGHEADPEKDIAAGGRPVTASDIAILFPTKSLGGELEELLNQKGIDTIWLSDSDIFQKPEAKTIWRFLDMLYGGARIPDMAAVMSDGLFMCTARELQRFLKEEQQGENAEELPCVRAQKYFLELRKIWEQNGIYAMFQKLLYEPNKKGRQWLCDIRDKADNNLPIDHFQDDSSLANHIIQTDEINGRYIFGRIRQLVDKLHRAAQKRHLTPGRLLAYLQGMINRDKELEDSGMEHNVQRNTDKPAVRLLTVHHSKGLEFPIVLLPNVISYSSPYPNRLFHDSGKNRCLDMADKHSEECKKEHFQERLRLLYVGLTRAKFACYAPYSTSSYKLIIDKLKQHPNFDDFKGDTKLADTERPDDADQDASMPARSFAGQAVWDWQVASFTGFTNGFHNEDFVENTLVEPDGGGDDEQTEEEDDVLIPQADCNGKVLPGDEEQEVIFSFAAGKKAGTIWHEIFEKMDFHPSCLSDSECFDAKKEQDLVAKLSQLSLYQTIRRRNEGDDEAKKRDIAFARMLKGILCNPMVAQGEAFMLKDIPQERRASELRFLYVLKKDTTLHDIKECLERHGYPTGDWAKDANSSRQDWALKGSIDLLLQTENGKYYVIDWKTNGLKGAMNNFTCDGMKREIDKKLYSLQYLLYAVAFWHFLKERQGVKLTLDSYQKYFGGVFYLFVRGMAAPLEIMSDDDRKQCQVRGIYYELPSFELISEMRDLLDIRSKH